MRMPNADQIEFKQKFVDHYSKLTDFEKFKEYCLMFLRRSIRVNTLKTSIKEIKERLNEWNLKQVPWCKEGFWISNERRDVGNLLEHVLGYFYVQEAASMIPPVVLRPVSGDTVLDMCAAPGSKTSQIAQYMKNKGLLVANDYKGDRLAALGINLQRCGVTNSAISLMYGQHFKDMQFDRVLVDAPCSGTGTIRKSLKTIRIWNINMIKKLSFTQKKLLETGFNVLKHGGTLVYSTCSVEPLEDEGVVSWLLEKYDNAKLEKIDLDIKKTKPILDYEKEKYQDDVKKTLRIWPQDNDTEGFYVAKIKKL